MNLKDFAPINALLLGIGIIFGTFEQFATGVPFGFAWFVNMLWFVVGFEALIVIGLIFYAIAIKGEAKILKEAEEEEK